jgi:hypothetical protein
VLLQNIGFALRQLRRNPGFTAVVVVTLGLAIGANTAIFSVVNALMLRSLPYQHPERVGTIFRMVRGGEHYDGPRDIDGEQWELLRDSVPSLKAAISSSGTNGVNLQAGKYADYVQAGRISAEYLDVLGISPALGRNFSFDEDRPQGPKAVILSYNLWHSVFNQDPNLLGQTIHLKGDSYTVIGILPPGSTTPLNADLYTALQPSRHGEGAGTNYQVVTRLRDSASWQQADAEINRAWAGWAAEYAK